MSLRDGDNTAANNRAFDTGACATEASGDVTVRPEAAAVSGYNRASGFVPAFRNADTGETRLSLFADGTPAPVHVLEGLPSEWVNEGGSVGEARRLARGIERGYLRNGRFHSLADAARIVAESPGD